jgi:hypothetical protein
MRLARPLLERSSGACREREEGRREAMNLNRCVLVVAMVVGAAAASGCKPPGDSSDPSDPGQPGVSAPNDPSGPGGDRGMRRAHRHRGHGHGRGDGRGGRWNRQRGGDGPGFQGGDGPRGGRGWPGGDRRGPGGDPGGDTPEQPPQQ